MMLLLSAPASPFGRKVKMTAMLKGVADRLKVETVDTSQANNPALKARNPLQKIPVLVLADGTELFDSRVICEFLDSLSAAPVLFPAAGMARWHTLRMGALADGVMEAALLLVYEKRFRAEAERSPNWTARQRAKIDAALDVLEAAPPEWHTAPDYGAIGLAAALGYLDFRHEGAWRAGHPALVRWLDAFEAGVPAFAATRPT